VLQDPAPVARVKGFGDNGVSLELHYWLPDPEKGRLDVASDLHLAVARAFRERGIEIPFPRREVRLLDPRSDAPSI
jgi:small-conductance mechanosensitive channel